MLAATWLVIGLGNPGPDYAGNRHNVGQMVLTQLADRFQARFRAHKTPATIAECRPIPGGPKIILAKPSTYMNLSGVPVVALAKFYRVPAERIVVVHDELDLPFDTVRIKFGGGNGGHNGIRDIAQALGTQDFVRIRVGIGRPPGRQDAADFVLRDFARSERDVLPDILARAGEAVMAVAEEGYLDAQQRFHAPA